MRGAAAFFVEATDHGWSVFATVTPDIGIDYVIAKRYCSIMIQFKTATLGDDNRYHFEVDKFIENPLAYVVYYLQDDNKFFLIPFSEYWHVSRFEKLKQRVFQRKKPYHDKMSIALAMKEIGTYEGKRSWDRLNDLSKLDGLFGVIKEFTDKQKLGEG
jgi:hypothetical protein